MLRVASQFRVSLAAADLTLVAEWNEGREGENPLESLIFLRKLIIRGTFTK